MLTEFPAYMIATNPSKSDKEIGFSNVATFVEQGKKITVVFHDKAAADAFVLKNAPTAEVLELSNGFELYRALQTAKAKCGTQLDAGEAGETFAIDKLIENLQELHGIWE